MLFRLGVRSRLALGATSLLASSMSASALSMPKPSSIKFFYGDMPFWRAEVVRIALFAGDVPFDDVRDQKRVDMQAAGKLPFGAFPIMVVDGKTLSQTQAMAVYAAKVAGIHPEDAWLAAKVDECISGCTDVTATIGKSFGLPAEEKVPFRQKLIAPDGRLRMHLGGLERICVENGACGHAVGESLTVADLAIWRLVGWLSGGVLDGIPRDYVATTFPAISKVVAAVDAHPKVVEWKAAHPKNYPAPKL